MGLFASILTYSRDRMDVLGFEEHPDAFNFENVPSTDFDTMYHVELLPFVGRGEDQSSIEIECPFRIRIFHKLLRATNTNRDEVIVLADTVVDDFVTAQNRLGTGIKTVQFDQMNIETIADNNDNAVRLIIEFTALIVKSTA